MENTITKKDWEYFHHAICSDIGYDYTNKSIFKIEEFLMYWLNGEEYPDCESCVDRMYQTFKDTFLFQGCLFRGIEIDENQYKEKGLKMNYVTSFTSHKEIALYFAGKSDEYGDSFRENTNRFLIEMNGIEAFSLDEFLLCVKNKTQNIDMKIVIDERVWEQEKIAFIDEKKIKITEIK